MTTYHVFGDTGGHYTQLFTGLQKIGMTSDLTLPSDVIVIHCGDLIHKGPNSNMIISMVDRIMSKNPGQWVQLAGNHEAQYFGGPTFWRDNKITSETVETLQQWYMDRLINFAYGIPAGATIHNLVTSKRGFATPDKPILLTHAGLTQPFWEKILHSEEDVEKLAENINALPIQTVTTSGVMLEGVVYSKGRSLPVGPAWAHSVQEVWASWKPYEIEQEGCTELPFIQIHGHTGPYDFSRNMWWAGTYRWFKQLSRVNNERKTLLTQVGDSLHIAIDPCYDKNAPDEPQPALKITTPEENLND